MGIPGTPGGAPSDWFDAAIREGMVDRVIIGNFECAMEQSGALLARLMRRCGGCDADTEYSAATGADAAG